MKKVQYKFNPDRLQYEKLEKPFGKRLTHALIYTIIIAGIIIPVRLVLDKDINSPKVNYFSKRNEELHQSFDCLNNEILQAEDLLGSIRLRDDKLYRSVFDLEPIPSSVRDAGFGGSQEYSLNLESRGVSYVTNTARKLEQLITRTKIQSNSLTDLYSKAKSQQLLLNHQPSIKPISPADHIWLTSTFGYRSDPFNRNRRMHSGIDLAGQIGIKIHATGDGYVKIAKHNHHGYGKEVMIDHGFGLQSIYGHLSSYCVSKGDIVKKGQIIGYLGDTGRSTGPHLHYEVRLNKKPVNPMYYFFEDLSSAEYKLITINSQN